MNNQPNGNAASGDHGRFVPISIQSREDVTTQHIQTVLAVIQNLNHVLARGAAWGEEESETNRRFDGGVLASVHHTMIKACDRLDEILSDGARWTLNKENDVHDAIVKMHEAQTKLAEENTRVVARHNKPSAVFKPTFATVTPHDGSAEPYFICFWGDLEKGQAIIGRGPTPADALLDFDDAFYRTPSQQVQLIANLQKPNPNEQ